MKGRALSVNLTSPVQLVIYFHQISKLQRSDFTCTRCFPSGSVSAQSENWQRLREWHKTCSIYMFMMACNNTMVENYNWDILQTAPVYCSVETCLQTGNRLLTEYSQNRRCAANSYRKTARKHTLPLYNPPDHPNLVFCPVFYPQYLVINYQRLSLKSVAWWGDQAGGRQRVTGAFDPASPARLQQQ